MNLFPTKERIEQAYGVPASRAEPNGRKTLLAALLEHIGKRDTLILERLATIQSCLAQPTPPSSTEERLGQLFDLLEERRQKDAVVEHLHDECLALRAGTYREAVLLPVARDLFLLHDRCSGYLSEPNGQDGKPAPRSCMCETSAMAKEIQHLQNILSELEEALGRMGISKIGKADAFDPSLHKVTRTEPVADPFQDRRILGTGRTGWMISREPGQPGKVLRQQEVIVGKHTKKEA
jgi:hypothetical protein